GVAVARRMDWKIGSQLRLESQTKSSELKLTGIIESGGVEDEQAFAPLPIVESLTGHPGQFKRLLVSAIVNPENALYRQFQSNPRSLSPKDLERYSCTPYITSVAGDLTK